MNSIDSLLTMAPVKFVAIFLEQWINVAWSDESCEQACVSLTWRREGNTYINIDRGHPFMATVLPNSSGSIP